MCCAFCTLIYYNVKSTHIKKSLGHKKYATASFMTRAWRACNVYYRIGNNRITHIWTIWCCAMILKECWCPTVHSWYTFSWNNYKQILAYDLSILQWEIVSRNQNMMLQWWHSHLWYFEKVPVDLKISFRNCVVHKLDLNVRCSAAGVGLGFSIQFNVCTIIFYMNMSCRTTALQY